MLNSHIDFSGTTAFITGASKGIGAATARRFAAGGGNVALVARSTRALENLAAEINQNFGDKALAISCDVADYGSVSSAVDATISKFGSVNHLVNNAGTIEPIARIEESDPAQWAKVVEINLLGVYHCLRACHAPMAQAKRGTVINISSGAATGALEGWSHYCATKAAVLSLTRCTHKEWSGQGINVVGLSPGTVATDMQVAIKESGVNPVSQLEWNDHISPDWVAEAIAWLTTKGAEQYYGSDFSLKTEEGRRQVGLA